MPSAVCDEGNEGRVSRNGLRLISILEDWQRCSVVHASALRERGAQVAVVNRGVLSDEHWKRRHFLFVGREVDVRIENHDIIFFTGRGLLCGENASMFGLNCAAKSEAFVLIRLETLEVSIE
jgi:hypothetical protein